MQNTAEALAPSSDANVQSDATQPEGTESQQPDNAAAPSTAAAPKASDTRDPETSGVQRRFDELTRQRHEAARDRDFWKERALRYEQSQQQAQPTKPIGGDAEKIKTEADFNWNAAEYQGYLIERSRTAAV